MTETVGTFAKSISDGFSALTSYLNQPHCYPLHPLHPDLTPWVPQVVIHKGYPLISLITYSIKLTSHFSDYKMFKTFISL